MEQNLNVLKKIKPVHAPRILFARILVRIDSLNEAPVQWKWGFAAAAFIVFVMNLGIVLKVSASNQKAGVEEVVSAMHLSTSNSFYNE